MILLGVGFLGLEIYEFKYYIYEFGFMIISFVFGFVFYMFVGIYGVYVVFGFMWISMLMICNVKRGLNLYMVFKFYVVSFYWYFIDVVWVFIFIVVYLMGMVG